jgi:DNA-binding MarR family transcriptional regulator
MSAESHPASRLDETVHQRVRLGILGILSEADHASFTYLRDALGVTDGNLSAHLQVLADAGLVQVDKEFVDRKPRTWVRSTRRGRATFKSEVATLTELVTRYGKQKA